MFIFKTTCVKKGIVEVSCEGSLNFPTLLLYSILISTYLNHLKINLNIIFALNFSIQYLFEFLVLIENMKNDERKKLIVYN